MIVAFAVMCLSSAAFGASRRYPAWTATDSILVYGSPKCSNCTLFIRSMKSRKIAYTYYDVDEDTKRNAEMYAKLAAAGIDERKLAMPVVEVNGALFPGGVTDISQLAPWAGKKADQNALYGLAALPTSSPPEGADFARVAASVRSMPKAKAIEDVVAHVRRNSSSDWEMAYGAYVWMTDNIAYDYASYLSGHAESATVDPFGVFQSGKTICAGYARLYADLASRLGLECEVVSGYAKAFAYVAGESAGKSNHDWNMVKLGGTWHLVDSTWAAGYLGKERKFEKHFTDFWFDTAPELFVLWHLPKYPSAALLAESIDPEQYRCLPFFELSLFENLRDAGFSWSGIMDMARRRSLPDLAIAAQLKSIADTGPSPAALDEIFGMISQGQIRGQGTMALVKSLVSAGIPPSFVRDLKVPPYTQTIDALAALGLSKDQMCALLVSVHSWSYIGLTELASHSLPADVCFAALTSLKSDAGLRSIEYLEKMGFGKGSIVDSLRSGGLPLAYPAHGPTPAIIDAPLDAVLAAGKELTFAIKTPDGRECAITNNKEWVRMKKEGDSWRVTMVPKAGTLGLLIADEAGSSRSFWTLLQYNVQ